MKFDDASWHYGGDFPTELPLVAGATHIAMFVAWAMLNGLAGSLHTEDFADDLAMLINRRLTPTEWFLRACDGKFTEEDLNDEGNAFAHAYYGGEDGLHTGAGSYIADYDTSFQSSKTLYHVPDTWATFSTLDPVIQARFKAWRNTRQPSQQTSA